MCELAGTGQGQEVLGGGWEGARAVSAAQLGRERCQHIPGAAGQPSVCGRGASARQLLTLPAAHPDGDTLSPDNLDPTVSPVMPQAPAATRRQDHPQGAVLPAQLCPPGRVLSPRSCWTPWDTDSPSVPPLLGLCMASPGALSAPKSPCSTTRAALEPVRDWDRKDESLEEEEGGRDLAQPTHRGPGDASLLTETGSVAPKSTPGE